MPLAAIIEAPRGDAVPVNRPAKTVVTSDAETADAIAASYHVDLATLRWANNLTWGANVPAGAAVLLPPGPGALVPVNAGETPSQFAARLHLDPSVVLDYNHLTSDSPLPAGTYLQVPVAAAPHGALNSEVFVPKAAGVPSVPPSQGHTDGYDFGECTWYVASKRDTSGFGGNAYYWWSSASSVRPEGNVPVAGAIVVERVGWFGHVAYVESVNPDGSFVVSEMNFYENGGGWGRVDYRTIAANDPGIMGFIY